MTWLAEKKQCEEEKARLHFLYMDSLNKIKQAEETINHYQKILPELKEIAKKYKSKRDRLDKEYKEKFADDSNNAKREELDKLLSRASKLKQQLRKGK